MTRVAMMTKMMIKIKDNGDSSNDYITMDTMMMAMTLLVYVIWGSGYHIELKLLTAKQNENCGGNENDDDNPEGDDGDTALVGLLMYIIKEPGRHNQL